MYDQRQSQPARRYLHHRLACSSNDIRRALKCSTIGEGEKKRPKMNSPEWRQKALGMDFRMRIGLGRLFAERKNEVVQVPMIVELTLIVIKRGIRALRISEFLSGTRPALCSWNRVGHCGRAERFDGYSGIYVHHPTPATVSLRSQGIRLGASEANHASPHLRVSVAGKLAVPVGLMQEPTGAFMWRVGAAGCSWSRMSGCKQSRWCGWGEGGQGAE